MFIDSHAHIDGPDFDSDRDEVVNRAFEAGVGLILNVGTGNPLNGEVERGVAVANQYDRVLSAAGIHPHDASTFDDSTEGFLKGLFEKNKRLVGLGEIGLDFHYDHSPRDIQKAVFRRQLRIARSLDVPVIIHSRAADDETIEILRDEWGGAGRQGIMHCFSGGEPLVSATLDLGFLISFSGNVTFKNAQPLRDIARIVPLERLLIETDCPFLTPVPFRGRRNEPARVVEVARCLAEVRGLDLAVVETATTENFVRCFRLEQINGFIG